jgi:hypothetical protein
MARTMAPTAPQTVAQSRMHAAITGACMVVSKALAARMQGSITVKTKGGSVYGYFANEDRAGAFITRNKMQLYAVIVPA